MAIKHSTMPRILSLLAYVALAVLIAYLVIDRHPENLPEGGLAPIETNITMLSGHTTSFKRLLKRPMVINFFATWCAACIKELPVFSKLAKKYDALISFVGAGVDSTPHDIAAFQKKFFISYDLGVAHQTTVTKWQAYALPTTYIIDQKGKILWAHAGLTTEEQLERAILGVLKP